LKVIRGSEYDSDVDFDCGSLLYGLIQVDERCDIPRSTNEDLNSDTDEDMDKLDETKVSFREWNEMIRRKVFQGEIY
jgi:hypothetical protein